MKARKRKTLSVTVSACSKAKPGYVGFTAPDGQVVYLRVEFSHHHYGSEFDRQHDELPADENLVNTIPVPVCA